MQGRRLLGFCSGHEGSLQACAGMRRREPLSSLFLKLAVGRIELAQEGAELKRGSYARVGKEASICEMRGLLCPGSIFRARLFFNPFAA